MNFRLRSSQVKLGQILKLVFSNEIGVYLIQFLTANSTVVSLFFVNGLEFPKIAMKNCAICSFRGLFGNFETKNWRIASKFGMGIAITSLHNIYAGFLKIQKKIGFL